MQISQKQLKALVEKCVREAIERVRNRVDFLSQINWGSVPDSEYEKQYVDLENSQNCAFDFCSKISQINGLYLFESCDTTEPYSTVLKELKGKHNFHEWQITEYRLHNDIAIVVICANIGDNITIIENDMEQLGWFRSIQPRYVTLADGKRYVALQFEPKFQDNANDIVRAMPYIFHWTPWYNVPSIEKNGLVSQCSDKNFIHPSRLYFVKYGTNQAECLNIGRQLYEYTKNKPHGDLYALLLIDVKKIPKEVNFFLDPRYDQGIFVENQNIPLSAIVGKNTFDLKTGNALGIDFRPKGL